MRDPGASALLTDLYQLSMLQTYFERGMTQTAVFELFFRRLPKSRNFLVAAGLEQALEFLENLAFAPDELEWLSAQGFPPAFVDQLASLRFAGDVQAVPEGTLLFPDEPIIRVVAPLPQAQLVETRLMNILHFQTLIASKAARARPCCNWSCVAAAASRPAIPCSRRASAASSGLAQLPEPLRVLDPAPAYPVRVSDGLRQLALEVDRRQAAAPG